MSEGMEHYGISRRRFLNLSLAAAGGVMALGMGRRAAGAQGGSTRWAFLSDTHIAADPEDNSRGHYPHRNLQKAFTQIAGDLPEGLVVTGDIARLTGRKEDYESFRKLLPPVERRPLYLALGNHDNRDNFLSVFTPPAGQKPPVKGKHIVTVDAGNARLVLLDSLFVANVTGGLLGKAQRTWLHRYLAAGDDRPVLLFFHHSLRDSDGDLLDAPRLFELIEPVRKVKALVFGHSHEYVCSTFAGIHLINLPAVGYNFTDDQPVAWVEARLTRDGGTFQLHAVGGNGQRDGRTEELAWRS